RARNQVLNVEDHAQLLADPFTIRVTDFRKRVVNDPGCADGPCRVAYRCSRLGHPVDVHPEEPLFADLPFDINDFQALRTRHPLGGFADFLQIQAETPPPQPVRTTLRPAPTKKWARGPLI